MTKTGVGFIVAGILVYLVASQTQVGWLYLIDAVIWGTLVVSAVLPRQTLKTLSVEQQVLLSAVPPGQVSLNGPLEGETVEIRLRVSNRGRLARYFIRLTADWPFEEPDNRSRHFLLTAVNPGATAVFAYRGNCYRRGRYPSSVVTLQSGGPLGLIVRRRVFNLPLNLTVYPAYYKMEELQATGEAGIEWGQGSRSTAAVEFYGSREYRYGDPLKYVHWRNTAKVGDFMIKEFEQSGQGTVKVVFDGEHNFGTGKASTLEYSIKIAASLVRLSADSGRNIDIIAGKMPLHNASFPEAMDYLAVMEPAAEPLPVEIYRLLEPGKVTIAIIPAVKTGLTTALLKTAGQGKGMVVVFLAGFSDDEEPDNLLAGFEGKGLDVIRCSPGELEGAVKALGGYLITGRKSPVGTE